VVGAIPFCIVGEEFSGTLVVAGAIPVAGSDVAVELTGAVVRDWLPHAEVGYPLGVVVWAAEAVIPLWLNGLRLPTSDSHPHKVLPAKNRPIQAILGFVPIGCSFLLE
jgi:hypothetical protein